MRLRETTVKTEVLGGRSYACKYPLAGPNFGYNTPDICRATKTVTLQEDSEQEKQRDTLSKYLGGIFEVAILQSKLIFACRDTETEHSQRQQDILFTNRISVSRTEMPWTRRSSSNRKEIVHIVVTGYQKKKEPRKHYVREVVNSRANRMHPYLLDSHVYTHACIMHVLKHYCRCS